MSAGDRRADTAPPEPVALPEAARVRLLDRAAQCLGSLEPAEIPQPLRRVARFEPRRRARLAGSQIAAALDADESFRDRVAETLRQDRPELAAAVAAGELPAAADPVDVAVAAYLLRPDGWPELLAAAATAVAQAAADRGEDAEVARLREQLDAVRNEADKAVAKVTAQLTEARSEVRLLRRRVHEERQRTKTAERRADDAEAAAEQANAAAAAAADRQAADVRKLRAQVTELTAQLAADRRATRADRSAARPGWPCSWTRCSRPRTGCAGSWRCPPPSGGRPTPWPSSTRPRAAPRPRPPVPARTCSTGCLRRHRRTSWWTATTSRRPRGRS